MKTKSNDSHLTEVVGYKVLANRSITGQSFSDIRRNDVSSFTTWNVMSLINVANGESGVDDRRKTAPILLQHDNENNSDKENASETNTIVLTNDDEYQVDRLPMEVELDPIINNSKRMTCCSCHITNRVNNELTFSKVPNTKIILQHTSSDDKRFQYCKETFRRKIFLQRLKVATNTQISYLTYCSGHKMQTEVFDVEYKTKDGCILTRNCKLVVPVDITIPVAAPTRSNRRLIYSPPTKASRTNTIVINQQHNGNVHDINLDEEETPLLELDFRSPYNKKTKYVRIIDAV
jgi:hypothetical protein